MPKAIPIESSTENIKSIYYHQTGETSSYLRVFSELGLSMADLEAISKLMPAHSIRLWDMRYDCGSYLTYIDLEVAQKPLDI